MQDSVQPRGCLDPESAALYLGGDLLAAETERVDAHIDECTSCRRLLSELARAATEDGRVSAAEPAHTSEGSLDPPPLAAGAKIGRYVVQELLGVGGMGVVYGARDPELDRKVALKRVRGDLGAGDVAQNRLLREAQAMARLSHPNVVSVYDLVVHGSQLFIAMERVEGVSLRTWLEEARRPWREVLARFVQAGRGLAAAHAVGLVHRDFKPDNVLCDSMGRVRVTDFGLARLLTSETERATESTHLRASALEETPVSDTAVLTDRSGMVLGTPAYMAPELLAGKQADPLSDQFAWCVALYEALYGARPFQGASLLQIEAAMREERLHRPPPDSEVPVWLRAAVVRGLRADPAARHASIEAALLAIEPPAARSYGRLVLGAAVTVLALAAGVMGARSWDARSALRACEASGHALTDTWDSERARAVHAAFLATGSPLAEDTFRGVEQRLDRYAGDLSAARVQACEDTRVRKTQSEPLLALRVECLAHQEQALRALTSTLVAADPAAVEHALASAEGLPPSSRCDADLVVHGPLAPALPPEALARSEETRQALAAARAIAEAGQPKVARGKAEEAEKAAAALGDPVLESEALWTLGSIADEAEDRAAADNTLRLAVTEAERIRYDAVIADAATMLARVAADEGAPSARADDWAARAEAAIERLGGDPGRTMALLEARFFARSSSGQYAEALTLAERLLALLESTPGSSHVTLGRALRREAFVLGKLGRYPKALETIARAAELQARELGPTHPETIKTESMWGDLLVSASRYDEALPHLQKALSLFATSATSQKGVFETLNSLGNAYEATGNFVAALDAYERSGQLAEQTFGPKDRTVARSYINRSLVYLDLDRPADAVTFAQRAVALARETLGPDHPDTASDEGLLGEVLLAAGRPAEARDSLEQALATQEKSLGPDHHVVAETLVTLAEALEEAHDPRAAIPLLERVLRIMDGNREAPLVYPWGQALLARALVLSHGDRVRARSLVDAALAALTAEGTRGEALAGRVRGWQLRL